MPSKFNAKYIVCTEFNYGEDPEAYLREISKHCQYVTGQLEKCPKTEKLHLQFTCYNKENLTWGFIKCSKYPQKYGKGELMINYAQKTETRIDGPWEFGEKPKEGGRPKLTTVEKLEKPIMELINENIITPFQIKKMQEAKNIYNILKKEIKFEEKGKKKGFWHYGPPRTGKSTAARTGIYYLKMANKWWDGYNGEDKVVLEDVDKSMKDWLGYFIKIWTDWWPFKGEIKGGIIEISIKEFHVTSNYSIDEIWDDVVLADAIYHRFEIINYK